MVSGDFRRVSIVPKNWLLSFIICALIVFTAPAWAADSMDDLERLLDGRGDAPTAAIPLVKNTGAPAAPPAPVAAATHIQQVSEADKPLRLTSNKDQLIRLDQDAASVIVNNPDKASVMLDSPRLLIVMPRTPGATSFSVLDREGNVILHKDIIVSNVQSQYVRIRRVCSGSGSGCVPTAYYYCPDGCYEITAVKPGSSGSVPAPMGKSGGGSGEGSEDELSPDERKELLNTFGSSFGDSYGKAVGGAVGDSLISGKTFTPEIPGASK